MKTYNKHDGKNEILKMFKITKKGRTKTEEIENKLTKYYT